MSKHVNLVLEIKEWAEDGETTLRKCRAEFSGGFDRQPWANIQHHGEPLLPHEIEGLNQIIAGFKLLVGEQTELVTAVDSVCYCGEPIRQDSCPKCGTWHDLAVRR
jgi:hypothetical protein